MRIQQDTEQAQQRLCKTPRGKAREAFGMRRIFDIRRSDERLKRNAAYGRFTKPLSAFFHCLMKLDSRPFFHHMA